MVLMNRTISIDINNSTECKKLQEQNSNHLDMISKIMFFLKLSYRNLCQDFTPHRFFVSFENGIYMFRESLLVIYTILQNNFPWSIFFVIVITANGVP